MKRTSRRLKQKPTQWLPLLRSGRDPAPPFDLVRISHPTRVGSWLVTLILLPNSDSHARPCCPAHPPNTLLHHGFSELRGSSVWGVGCPALTPPSAGSCVGSEAPSAGPVGSVGASSARTRAES